MTIELVQLLAITSTNVSITNTTTLTDLFSYTVPGGTLEDHNKLRLDIQGQISFAAQNSNIDLWMYYAGLTITSINVKNIASTARERKGLRVTAELSGDGSINSQCGLAHSYLGLPRSEDGSTPIGFGTIGASSNGDQTFAIKGQWSAAGLSNSIINAHSTLELLSYVEEIATDDLESPTAYIFLNSRLNRLRYTLRKYCYFYAPLKWELNFYGYGDVSFARAGTSTATWLDGVAHSVAANEPRFEYTGSTVSGLAINTATETLTFDTDNSLNDSNTLCWLENGTFKSTPTNTNPFNSSGVWVGNTGIHITEIVKFNKVLTTAEIAEVRTAIE